MDTRGLGGGYDWQGAGQLFGPIPAYKSSLTVAFTQLTSSNLYLPCHGGCWKMDGSPCDGGSAGGSNDVDITRYICFLINGKGGCSGNGCPLYHIRSSDGVKIYRNDTANFPRECYSQHCGPGGGGVGACMEAPRAGVPKLVHGPMEATRCAAARSGWHANAPSKRAVRGAPAPRTRRHAACSQQVLEFSRHLAAASRGWETGAVGGRAMTPTLYICHKQRGTRQPRNAPRTCGPAPRGTRGCPRRS
jgi:hypothetical protein